MDSDALRWILLGIGIAGIAAIWLVAGARIRANSGSTRAKEPSLDGPPGDSGDDADVNGALEDLGGAIREGEEDAIVIRASAGGRKERLAAREKEIEAASGIEEMIASLHIVARAPEGFHGPDLTAAFEAQDLHFGEMSIYHRRDGQGATQFSAVNIVNPGIFDPAAMEGFTTPGISLFAVLPGSRDGVETFDAMLDCAKGLAKALNGSVLDETRSAVTRQGCEHTREQIRSFEMKQRRPQGRR